MKLVFIMITTVLLQVSATSFGQKVSITEKNVSLEYVIKKLRLQTGFDFLVDTEVFRNAKKISINLNNVTLDEALKVSTSGLNLNYNIEGKSVVITKKEPNIIERIIENYNAVEVSGTIVDNTGNVLPGATVKIKGTTISVVTDENGRFNFSGLKGNETLVVTYVGFDVQEFSLNKTSGPFTIKLTPVTGKLEEVKVVNTGYQELNKVKSTGAIVTLSAEELEKRNAINIFDNLEGTVPGLVRYRGNTTIRGIGTINANTSVLVVVDGFPLEGSVADLNPYDIESINVLKDAAAASIYGARATNGVIVVTTKKATVKNKTTVEFSVNLNQYNKPDYSYRNYLTPAQQVDYESNYYKWWFSGAGGTVANPVSTFENDILGPLLGVTPIQYAYYQNAKNPAQFTQAQLDARLNQYRQNNLPEEYRKYALLKQLIQQYNLAIRTNNGRSQSSLVLNYTGDNTGIINSYNKQLNIFYKGTYTVGKWLDINYGVNSILEYVKTNVGIGASPFSISPYLSMFNADGSLAYYSSNDYLNTNVFEKDPNLRSMKYNHLEELSRDFSKSTTFNTRYYVGLNAKILPGLSINPTFQYEDNKRDVEAVSPVESLTMRSLLNEYTTRTTQANGTVVSENVVPVGGRLINNMQRTPSYTARAQANYNKEFGKHGIVAIAGAEFRQTLSSGRNSIQYGYNDQLQAVNNLINYKAISTTPITPYWRSLLTATALSGNSISREVKHRFASVYANATYTFDQKYNIFGSVRKDYADIFGADEEYRGRPLWSIGAGWIASNEDFIRKIDAISFLKVRGSYGITGNVNLSAVSALIVQNGTNAVTLVPNGSVPSPPNDQLRWESTASTNLGVDFELFKSRLRGTLDLYKKAGSDILAQKRLDPSEGWTTLNMNNAKMVNKGVELSLSYDWFKPGKSQGFRWSSTLVLTHNKGKVTEVDGNIGTVTTIANGNGFLVGYSPNSIFSLRFAGLDAVGLPLWYNAAGEKTSVNLMTSLDNLVYSGVTTPTRTIGFNNDIAYKGFSLNVFAVYYGGHVLRATPEIYPPTLQYPYIGAAPSYIAEAWTPTNTNTVVPGAGQYYRFWGIGQTQYPISDFRVRAADFIKIRNIVLGYNLPQELARKIKAGAIRVRFQVNNPPTVWMKQKDVRIDTETGGAPALTSYVLGLNINF